MGPRHSDRLARRTAALSWLALLGAACAGRVGTREAPAPSPIASASALPGSARGAGDSGVPTDGDGGDAAPVDDGGAPPAVTFTGRGCIFEGKKYSQYDTFSVGERVCGCSKGSVSCRPRGTKECYARGRWTRPGEWGPASDGCNSLRCPTETQPAAMTLLDCRIVIPDRVVFSSGSAILSEEARQRVAALAEVLKTILTRNEERLSPVELVEVGGHAGVEERKPDDLARARAEAVRDTLVRAGVPAAFLKAVGHGKDQPTAPSTSPRERALNRRVELSLIEGRQPD